MMSWFRRTPTEETGDQHPPHADHDDYDDYDDEADTIRQVLYLAGFHPHRDKSGGRVRAGYRVDDTGPGPTFLVRHAGDRAEDRQRQERAYAQALAVSGYVVQPIAEDPAGGLRVWPLGQRPPLPAIDPREQMNEWLRSLTIMGEGKSIEATLALIATVNQVGTHTVPIRTPLPPDDAHALESVLAWNNEIRSRQAGVNLLVEQFLIRWLAEATGQTWNQIVQRLALAIEELLPPEQR
jgi:hypothetical protein